MEVSAGILIWRISGDRVEFFVGTPGGPEWRSREYWNFPKGHLEDGEDPFTGAHREFAEETGVKLSHNEHEYIYHGRIKQRTNKFVHVYSKKWDGEKLDEECYSNTFVWTDGKEYPEIKAYRWMTSDEIKQAGGSKAYFQLFDEIEKVQSNGLMKSQEVQ